MSVVKQWLMVGEITRCS